MAGYYPFLSRAQTALADSKLGILIAATTVGSTTFLVTCLVSSLMINQLQDGLRQARATPATAVHQVSIRSKNAPFTADAYGSEIKAVQLLP